MYRPANFAIHELVSPEIYAQRGQRGWELLDERALRALQDLRDRFGRIRINDYEFGGKYRYSGFRPPECTVGAKLSQHRFGRAFDCKFHDHTAKEVYHHIVDNPEDFPLITTLENIDYTPTWLHMDVRMNPETGIRIVNP